MTTKEENQTASATMSFQRDYETRGVIGKPLGRLILSEGNVVRLLLTPDGLMLIVNKSAIESGAVIIAADYEADVMVTGFGVTGFGKL